MPKPSSFSPSRTFIVSLGCLVALLLQPAAALAAELPNAKLEKLAQEIQQALERDKRPVRTPTIGNNGRQLLASLRSGVNRGDLAQVESALTQLAFFLESEPLRARCEEAGREIRALREAKDKAAADEIAALFKRAADIIRSARKPSDLDGLLQELGNWRAQRTDRPGSNSDTAYRVEPAIQFVTYWQNYLAQTAVGGDAKTAQATLDQIIGMNQGALLPRSEILARRYGELPSAASSPIAAIQRPNYMRILDEGLKAPEDLLPVMEDLGVLARDPDGVSSAERPGLLFTIDSLAALYGVYKEFKAGLPTRIELVLSDPHRTEPMGAGLGRIRGELIRLVLPRYLGVEPHINVQPHEGAQDYLKRVVEYALNHGDYALAARARDTERLLRDGKTEVSKESTQADLVITARNQEIAGQFSLAVTSYERALASGTDIVPANVIGERLARIKAEHPKEFEDGFQNYISVGPGKGRPPGVPPRPQTSATPALAVPAANPSAQPTGSPTPSGSPAKQP